LGGEAQSIIDLRKNYSYFVTYKKVSVEAGRAGDSRWILSEGAAYPGGVILFGYVVLQDLTLLTA